MNNVLSSIVKNTTHHSRLMVLGAVLLAGCSGDLKSPSETIDTSPTGDFELRTVTQPLQLIEGDENGLTIPLSLDRKNGHTKSVDLSIAGVSPDDAAFISSSFTHLTLTPNADQSEMILKLAIADLPILPQQREFVLTASDGIDRDDLLITVDVTPVDAPDVYLLVGQSNMVGFSGDGTRQAWPGGLDEPHPRIRQLNVTPNNRQDLFMTGDDFSSNLLNVSTPAITTAEDPLHVPLDLDNPNGKELEYIGLGLSFAKRALQDTSSDIILVPAAWSGSSFCLNEGGPNGQWNAQPTTDPNLGNTWLFDRAVTRANLALAQTGGILRGILWHQGESDANERCAESYSQNLERLVRQLRVRISPDRRGGNLRQPESNIPFVAGTMSRGIDERGDLSDFPVPKQLVDLAHHNLPNQVAHTSLSIHDDLTPANGYPCGNTTCVHFGAEALREMGGRYYNAMVEAAQREE